MNALWLLSNAKKKKIRAQLYDLELQKKELKLSIPLILVVAPLSLVIVMPRETRKVDAKIMELQKE